MTLLLAMLPFTAVLWAITWSLRYLPIPFRSSLTKIIIMLVIGVAFTGTWVAQIGIYRWITGVGGIGNSFVFEIFIPQSVIALLIMLNGAYHRRNQEKLRSQSR
jgi:hypothetical protein